MGTRGLHQPLHCSPPPPPPSPPHLHPHPTPRLPVLPACLASFLPAVVHVRCSGLATSPWKRSPTWCRDNPLSLPLQGPVISKPGRGLGAGGVPTEGSSEHRLHNWTAMPPGWTFPLSRPCFPDGKTQAETNDPSRTMEAPACTAPLCLREGARAGDKQWWGGQCSRGHHISPDRTEQQICPFGVQTLKRDSKGKMGGLQVVAPCQSPLASPSL